jgi:hypothetical protein
MHWLRGAMVGTSALCYNPSVHDWRDNRSRVRIVAERWEAPYVGRLPK